MALSPPNDGNLPAPKNDREQAANDGFLREVDEALREEQMVTAFKRYAVPVGGAIALGLTLLGGYLFWESSQKGDAAQWAERNTLVQDRLGAGAVDPAIKDLQLIAKDGGEGQRALALVQLAALAARQGKLEDAARQFAAVAADSKVPQPYRDLALIRQTAIEYDKLNPQDVINRLKPLAVPGNPWFGSAGEMVGMAYLDQNKPDMAGAILAQVGKDSTVPTSIRSRARQLAGGLGFDAGIDNPELIDGNTADAPAPATPAAK